MLIETKNNLHFAIIIRKTHLSRIINIKIPLNIAQYKAKNNKGKNGNLMFYILVIEISDNP